MVLTDGDAKCIVSIMDTDLATVDDLFSTLGGPAAVARLIGVSTEHATAMRRRRSIPVDYWPALLESEGGKQINLTSDDLVRVHTSHSKQGDAA